MTSATASSPFWSILIISIDVAALYALCVYDSRENLGTRRAAQCPVLTL
jgi:hypothetical protein